MQVFLTGTERLEKMNAEMWTRIHNITKLNATILIGNYRGFDQLALAFLNVLEYRNVKVYETGSGLSFGHQIIDVGRYPRQDIEMSRSADYMLAVYDGLSYGVKANLRRMPAERTRIIYVNI
ncbi:MULTISPECIES: hypothetical protein [unclassified Microcoleus]|uniref:hypothetical protein n=1 Tax=unclassified Microcoleus TaxID=2642155 RepID=UPI002FD4EFCB